MASELDDELDELGKTLNDFQLSKPMVTALLDGMNSWLTSSPPCLSLSSSSSDDKFAQR